MIPILTWDKPAKKMTAQEWREYYGFDGGPSGGYMPNMSDDDAAKWKAKLTGTKLGFPQVEIRKSFRSSQLTCIVNLGNGYNYKQYRARSEKYYGKTPADFASQYYMSDITQEKIDERAARDSTAGIQIHLAMNRPAQLTFDDMAELNEAILEAKAYLEAKYPLVTE
jgi:hypothetical protein